jgi:superoxide dismutase, Fe-Mn family
MSSSRLAYRLVSSSRQAVRAFAVARVQARHAHNLRTLEYPVEGGLGDFLPPNVLKTVAVDWQQGLLQRLSEEIKGVSLLVCRRVLYLICVKTRSRRVRR